MIYRAILISILLISFQNSESIAFDDAITHRDITIKAVENSILTNYLSTNLGGEFSQDYRTVLNGKKIIDLIKDGSIAEDNIPSMCRASNHFHNPTKPWNQAGLSGYQGPRAMMIDDYCSSTAYTNKYSNVVWATNYLSPSPDGSKGNTNNDINWDAARTFYKNALTASLKAEREANFAKTFRAIGQVMHLLEDTAVPAHVRNDFRSHLYQLNNVGFSSPTTWPNNPFELYVKLHKESVTSITNPPVILATRLTDFWDTDQYTGSNPAVTSFTAGLSEYTNANFASDLTIFTENFDSTHSFYFPYPKKDGTEEYIEYNQNGEKAIYFRKNKDGETVNHFAVAKRFYKYLGFSPLIQRTFIGLDDKVHADYASLLIPRAVGYSAGLINYFFRGDIDLQEDASSGSGYVIVNNTEEDMQGTFEIYYDKASYDRAGNRSTERILFWSSTMSLNTKSSGNNKSQNISFSEPTDAAEPGKYILVFSGRLGSEENAILGKVVSFPDLYIMVMPVNHETREIEGKQYYSMKVTGSNNTTATLTQTTETSLPFTLLDDGGYWDSMRSSWTATTSPESLGAPLHNGGPQYIAKYLDSANNRIRFVPNLTYEKEAYLAFNGSYGGIKEMHYVNYIGSPLFAFGMYSENPGWMEYTDSGLYTILSPQGAKQLIFSLYKGNNFNDTFIETPYLKFYDFNGADLTASIPKDPEAPYSSIAGAYKPAGESYVKVSIPKVYNTYIKPNPVWKNGMSTASSGVEYYRLYPNIEATYETEGQKCSSEDNNCGNAGTNGSTVKTVFDIPYNFNSYIRVHRNDGGKYYEEIYINGQPVQNSTPSAKFETHYQILAIYKDTAIVRETNYVSTEEIPLDYRLESNRIYERHWNFTSKYYIYINGKRYDLQGATNTTTKHLNVPYFETASGVPRVDYLTYESVDDITGYHLDRIFISDTFDGSYLLVAFDEYAYNNGEGLTHDMKYESSDSDATKHILYYDIPKAEIQNADHEAIRTGRKLLLFKSDGTLKQELQDPIGLDKTIGSIGILN